MKTLFSTIVVLIGSTYAHAAPVTPTEQHLVAPLKCLRAKLESNRSGIATETDMKQLVGWLAELQANSKSPAIAKKIRTECENFQFDPSAKSYEYIPYTLNEFRKKHRFSENILWLAYELYNPEVKCHNIQVSGSAAYGLGIGHGGGITLGCSNSAGKRWVGLARRANTAVGGLFVGNVNYMYFTTRGQTKIDTLELSGAATWIGANVGFYRYEDNDQFASWKTTVVSGGYSAGFGVAINFGFVEIVGIKYLADDETKLVKLLYR